MSSAYWERVQAENSCRRFSNNRNSIIINTSNGNPTEILSKIHKDLSSGLLYTHTRINANTNKNLEAASFLYTLIEILSEKGLLKIEELDERKRQVAQRLVNRFVDSGLGSCRILNTTSTHLIRKLMLTARADLIFAKRSVANFLSPCQNRM